MSDTPVFDFRGLICPLPVLKTRKAMQEMRKGETVWVEITDPLAVIDIPSFCRENGHRLVEMNSGDGFLQFLIQRG